MRNLWTGPNGSRLLNDWIRLEIHSIKSATASRPNSQGFLDSPGFA